jgi:hypothetical protein
MRKWDGTGGSNSDSLGNEDSTAPSCGMFKRGSGCQHVDNDSKSPVIIRPGNQHGYNIAVGGRSRKQNLLLCVWDQGIVSSRALLYCSDGLRTTWNLSLLRQFQQRQRQSDSYWRRYTHSADRQPGWKSEIARWQPGSISECVWSVSRQSDKE